MGNGIFRRTILGTVLALCVGSAGAANAATGKRVQISGEIVDSWCYVTEIMYALGTAHHKCAVWCAIGGVPVSIKADDGKLYMVLRVEDDDTSVANPKIVRIQTHQVTVDGDLYVRDGVNYLIVNKVADDKGVVNLTNKEYGVQPF
jgi:type 1 fimbria pilin